ncbi:D-alanyl-D-alanine carboxypeptidase family protein [Actinospongicola halichondriae]|uniref:D-alanyl-D-alanine carboxypeptidase family protein n=1 Tax=Actinospongicola halichondriae TaxID=3236844 RepID=UPI003D597985
MTLLTKHPLRALVATALILGMVIVPATAQADTKSDREAVQRKRAAVAAQVDTLKATDAQVEAALATLNANVASQSAALADAERKSAEADAALAAATAEVEAKQAEIVELDAAVKDVAIAAFIRPPSSSGVIDSLSSSTIGEAELKKSLLEAKSSSQLDVLDQLERAREDLETARSNAEAAAAAAEQNRNAVDAKLAEVSQARDQQQKVAADVQARLDQRLGEAASLAALDKELGAKYASEQKAIAAQLAKAAASAPKSAPSSGGSTVSITGSGSIVSVRGIQVHKSIAGQLASMLSAADGSGISLSGGGYRSSAGQIQTRRNNCGTSNYAVYQMPPSQCSPPTARPGTSMHERGLAIDFTYNGRIINSRSSPAYQWLAANASSYGFYNLPSEPWHWSVNGN